MSRTRGLARTWLVWLALATILLTSLMPALTRVWGAGAPSAEWLEVCRGTARVWVAVADLRSPGREAPQPDQGVHALQHCPCCHLHADAILPAPTAMAVAHPGYWTATLPIAFLQAPRTPFAWRPIQPQAPPRMG